MSTTSMAIFSNPLFASYSVYARNASFELRMTHVVVTTGAIRRQIVTINKPTLNLFVYIQMHLIETTLYVGHVLVRYIGC